MVSALRFRFHQPPAMGVGGLEERADRLWIVQPVRERAQVAGQRQEERPEAIAFVSTMPAHMSARPDAEPGRVPQAVSGPLESAARGRRADTAISAEATTCGR